MSFKRLSLSLPVAAAMLVFGFGACGYGSASAPAAQATNSQVPIEGAFRYAMDLDAAGDANRLWVYLTGRDRDDKPLLSQRLFERDRAGSWRELPAPPVQLNLQSQAFVAEADGRLCFAYTRQQAGTDANESGVACRDAGGWRPYAPRFTPIRSGAVEQLVGYRGAPTVLVRPACSKRDCPSVDVAYRWDDGRWSRLAPGMASSGGISTMTADGSQLLLSISETGGAAAGAPRTVYELQEGRWRQLGAPLVGRTIGPSVSGPQRVDGRTWIAVNEANRDPWRFSLFSRRGVDDAWRQYLGRPLNVGAGHAQGAITTVGGRLWATWSEERAKPGRFPFWERLYAARIDPDGATRPRPIELRAGLSIGPPSMQLVCGAGATWALYLATTRWGGYDPRLRRLSASGC
jgi:hypothetical protein